MSEPCKPDIDLSARAQIRAIALGLLASDASEWESYGRDAEERMKEIIKITNEPPVIKDIPVIHIDISDALAKEMEDEREFDRRALLLAWEDSQMEKPFGDESPGIMTRLAIDAFLAGHPPDEAPSGDPIEWHPEEHFPNSTIDQPEDPQPDGYMSKEQVLGIVKKRQADLEGDRPNKEWNTYQDGVSKLGYGIIMDINAADFNEPPASKTPAGLSKEQVLKLGCSTFNIWLGRLGDKLKDKIRDHIDDDNTQSMPFGDLLNNAINASDFIEPPQDETPPATVSLKEEIGDLRDQVKEIKIELNLHYKRINHQ